MSRMNGRRPQRRFLILSCSIFLGLYGGILTLQWTLLRRQAIADAEATAKAMTSLFVHELTATGPLSQILDHLNQAKRFEYLDHLIRHRLGKFGLRKSKVYDRFGTVLYADDPALVGKAFAAKTELREALSGRTVSKVLSEVEYANLYGVTSRTSVVETYVPLQERARDAPRYVFEAYQDFDPARTRLQRTVLISGTSLALIVGLALGAVALSYRRIHKLKAHVETLERLLPICSRCKNIRVEGDGQPDHWVAVETYFRERDRVEFTHGLCNACLDKHLAALAARKNVAGHARRYQDTTSRVSPPRAVE